MRILVTGGAGFIGSNFVRRTLEDAYPGLEGAEVVVYDALTYSGNLENLAPVADSPRYRFVQGDIRDAGAARRACCRASTPSCTSPPSRTSTARCATPASSSRPTCSAPSGCSTRACAPASAASCTSRPTRCTARSPRARGTRTRPLEPNSPYSASKAGSDLLARSYFRTHGMNLSITRCSNNYGPYHFPEKVIPLFVTNLIDDQHVPLYGEGDNIRDWLHVDDHTRGIALVRHGRPRRRDLQHRRRHRAHQQGAHPAAARRDRQGLVVRRPGRGPQGPRPALLGRHLQDPVGARLRAARPVRAGPRRRRAVVPRQPGVVGAAQGAGRPELMRYLIAGRPRDARPRPGARPRRARGHRARPRRTRHHRRGRGAPRSCRATTSSSTPPPTRGSTTPRRTRRRRSRSTRPAPRTCARGRRGCRRAVRAGLDRLRLRRRGDRAVPRGRAARSARRLRPHQGRGRAARARRASRSAYIVRTAWLYGAARPELRRARCCGSPAERDTVSVVDDQVGQPTWTARPRARRSCALLDADAPGRHLSRHELAARRAGSTSPARSSPSPGSTPSGCSRPTAPRSCAPPRGPRTRCSATTPGAEPASPSPATGGRPSRAAAAEGALTGHVTHAPRHRRRHRRPAASARSAGYAEELTRELIETAPRGSVVEGIVSASPEADYATLATELPGPRPPRQERARPPRAARGLAHGVHRAARRRDGARAEPARAAAPPRPRCTNPGEQIVVTIHDALAWTRPDAAAVRHARPGRRAMAKRAERHADAIVVPTHAVADELAEHPRPRRAHPRHPRRARGSGRPGCRRPRRELEPARAVPARSPVARAGRKATRRRCSRPRWPRTRRRARCIVDRRRPAPPTPEPRDDLPASRGLDAEPRREQRAAARRRVAATSIRQPSSRRASAWPARGVRVRRARSCTPTPRRSSRSAGRAPGTWSPRDDADGSRRLGEAIAAVLDDLAARASGCASPARDRARAFSWRDSAEKVWQLHADL